MLEMIVEHNHLDTKIENLGEFNNLLYVLNGKINERALYAIFEN
jgi:recombinational DNA repair protein RecR